MEWFLWNSIVFLKIEVIGFKGNKSSRFEETSNFPVGEFGLKAMIMR